MPDRLRAFFKSLNNINSIKPRGKAEFETGRLKQTIEVTIDYNPRGLKVKQRPNTIYYGDEGKPPIVKTSFKDQGDENGGIVEVNHYDPKTKEHRFTVIYSRKEMKVTTGKKGIIKTY